MARTFKLTIAVLALLGVLSQQCRALEFLTTGSGQYIVDQNGGRLVGAMPSAHCVIVNSLWPAPEGIAMTVIACYNADRTAIEVYGFADVAGSTIAQTQVMTVDSAGVTKVLKTCPGPRCDQVIPKATMRAGANDIWLRATTAAGVPYGATTKMSPP